MSDNFVVSIDIGDLTIKRQADSLTNELVDKNKDKYLKELSKIDKSDLDPQIYEGGLKVWESSYDLAEYLLNEIDCNDKKVLELGCGAAIPSIVSAKKGAKKIVCQDYNQSVLDLVTKNNIKLNEINEENYNLISCSWDEWSKNNNEKFDIILTSETIYEVDSYESLHDAFDNSLTIDGIIILAAKMIYFGKTGDYFKFLDYLDSKNKFQVIFQQQIEATVKRIIAVIKRKN